MSHSAIPTAKAITRLQAQAVEQWHQAPIGHWNGGSEEGPYKAFFALVLQQHECNFRLWHEEDKARSRSASDSEIAAVKRAIDTLNQQRNDRIEFLDDAITQILDSLAVVAKQDATMNTETLGSVIDRLSIMSLRIFHYREQLERPGMDAAHQQKVAERLSICQQQIADLTVSLEELIRNILSGEKRHRTYRQLKMYNDPSLNPWIDGGLP